MELIYGYLAGLLTLINPCVLPVLPIVLAGFIWFRLGSRQDEDLDLSVDEQAKLDKLLTSSDSK